MDVASYPVQRLPLPAYCFFFLGINRAFITRTNFVWFSELLKTNAGIVC